jgi:ribonuclease HII
MTRPTFQVREQNKARRREQSSLRLERKLWKKGIKYVACLDEAGRGPLAGPVLAAACLIVDCRFKAADFKGLKDSKKLSRKQREKFYKIITKNKNIEWGIGRVSERMIDKINILEASKLAMKKAVAKLKKKPDLLILDGKMKLDLPVAQQSIVKADEKVFSCACASILAKVTRDRIMEKYHLKYPRYCLNDHKGYPTKIHLRMLKRYGPCKIHRMSFEPVRTCKTKRTVVT